jgi:hypothetical protein
MLQLRPNCECCNTDLPSDSEAARICSFECTFCVTCADGVLGSTPARVAALHHLYEPLTGMYDLVAELEGV